MLNPHQSRGLVLLLTALIRYLVLADLTIADLIGSDLQATFHTSPDGLLLARNVMPISLSLGIPLSVLLANRFGLARIVEISLVGFATALLLSASATSLTVFTLGRLLQGLATAVLSSQIFALVQVYLPRTLLTQGVSLIAAVGGLGLATGPLLASFAAGSGAWRMTFAGLATAALVLAALARLALRHPEGGSISPVQRPIGFVAGSGLCLVLAVLVCRWPAGSVLNQPGTRGLEFLGLLILGIWLLRFRVNEPGPLGEPVFQLVFTVRMLIFGVVATPGFFVLLYLRNQFGWTIGQTALLGLSFSGPMLVGISLSGMIAQRCSLRLLLVASLSGIALGSLGWVAALPDVNVAGMLISNATSGVAIGVLIPAVTAAGVRAAPSGHAYTSSAWLVLADSLGPMLGFALQGGLLLAVVAWIWTRTAQPAGLAALEIHQWLPRVQQALPVPANAALAQTAFVTGLQSVYLSSIVLLLMLALASGRWLQAAKAHNSKLMDA